MQPKREIKKSSDGDWVVEILSDIDGRVLKVNNYTKDSIEEMLSSGRKNFEEHEKGLLEMLALLNK